MKIIDIPQFGPMFRFSDANIYWALYTLSDGKRMGRKKLADTIGVGEGSMRRILESLREWNFINIKQTGITITKAGITFLNQIPIKVIEEDFKIPVVGDYSQAVLVFGVANKINDGMRQRDAGIKVGADGCTTLVIKGGVLMIPPDWNVDKESPEEAYKIRKGTGMTKDDVLIVGSGTTKQIAIEAALNAAFELF